MCVIRSKIVGVTIKENNKNEPQTIVEAGMKVQSYSLPFQYLFLLFISARKCLMDMEGYQKLLHIFLFLFGHRILSIGKENVKCPLRNVLQIT